MNTIDDIIRRFKTYKIDIEGRSENTLEYYIVIIKDFCAKMNITEFDEFVGVKAETIRDWLSIIANNNSANTRNKKLSTIKEIYKYLDYQEHLDIDRDIARIPFAKVPYREPRYTTKEDIETLKSGTTRKWVLCAITMLSQTGMRFSELLQITCSDIERGYAKIIGKGNKERIVFFNPMTINECKRYINFARKKLVEKYNINSDLLFVSRTGRPYTLQTFSHDLKASGIRMGLDWSDSISAHKFRHGYATELLNNNAPIQAVRDILGHSTIATTNRYSHTSTELIKSIMTEER